MSSTKYIPCGANFYLESTEQNPYRGNFKQQYSSVKDACDATVKNTYCHDGNDCPALKQIPVFPFPSNYASTTGLGWSMCGNGFCPTYYNGQVAIEDKQLELAENYTEDFPSKCSIL